MSAILFDGFDLGDTEHRWTSPGGSVLSTNPVRSGTHSRAALAGAAGPYLAFDPQEDDVVYIGFGFHNSALAATGDLALFWFSEGNNLETGHIVLIRKTNVRGWAVRGGAFWNNPSAGTLLIDTIPNVWFPSSWHYIEIGVKIHDSAGWVELRQDGVAIGRFDGDTFHQFDGLDGLIDTAVFHQRTNANGYNIDDVYILNEQGSVNNSWLGDTRVFPLYPDGNGNYSQLVGSDADSTDNYLLVDEVGTPVTTDYVASATPGDKDTYTFEDLPVILGTIRGIEIRAHASKDDTGTKQIRMITRRSSTDSFGPDHVLAAIPLWQTHHDIEELDPHAGPGAWTIPNINATEWGVEVRS